MRVSRLVAGHKREHVPVCSGLFPPLKEQKPPPRRPPRIHRAGRTMQFNARATPLVERQSIEQMMASSREHSEQDIVRLPPDEERSIVQALTDHFRKTLDEPIPALGGQTPRKAVKTAKGRKKVIAWLNMLENQSARRVPRIRWAPTTSRGCGENSALATSGGDRIEAGVRQCGKARHLRQRMANAPPSPGPKSRGRFWWYGSL